MDHVLQSGPDHLSLKLTAGTAPMRAVVLTQAGQTFTIYEGRDAETVYRFLSGLSMNKARALAVWAQANGGGSL